MCITESANFKILIFMYLSVLLLCMSMHHTDTVPKDAWRGSDPPVTGVSADRRFHLGSGFQTQVIWKSSHPVFLTVEPFLNSPNPFILKT